MDECGGERAVAVPKYKWIFDLTREAEGAEDPGELARQLGMGTTRRSDRLKHD